jgi:hypothetical protein
MSGGTNPRDFLLHLPALLLPLPSSRLLHCDVVEAQDMSALRDMLICPSLARSKPALQRYLHDQDMYTQTKITALDKPEIDHILERQFVSYGLLSSGIAPSSSQRQAFLTPIKDAVNAFANLNITSAAINSSKGSAFTSFIKEDRYTARPRPLHVILNSDNTGRERAVAQHASNVLRAVQQAFPTVSEEIAALRRYDGHVTGHRYVQLGERLQDLYDRTGGEEFIAREGVKTRSQTSSSSSIKKQSSTCTRSSVFYSTPNTVFTVNIDDLPDIGPFSVEF